VCETGGPYAEEAMLAALALCDAEYGANMVAAINI
jgi:hypothetical protein